MKELSLKLAKRTIKTNRPAFIMGIVNATPDSFFCDSRGGIELALKHIEEGADIIDIGGESTRPGASYVPVQEELNRIIPVIKGIRKHSDIPISVDTRKKTVMQQAFECGADILNDVSALEDDKDLAKFVATKNIPVILMHKRGTPSTMQKNTEYIDVLQEVNDYLNTRIEYALSQGVLPSNIIIDPGIGFGKNLTDNKTLIANCNKLCGGKYPVLMALSRKSCIKQIIQKPTDECLYGTLAANMISVLKGAFMLRVHDVAPCRDTLDVLKSFIESQLL